MSRTRLRVPLGLAILAATVAVYHPVRHHAFVDLDDYAGIVLDPDLHVASLRGEAPSGAGATPAR